MKLGRDLLQRAALVILAGLALLAASPAFEKIPNLDSGNFLYAGAQMLKGSLPFRDFWASHSPLIYALDALGLAVGLGSRWGVWALEWVSLAAAALLAQAFLKRYFSAVVSWLAVAAMVLNLAYFFQDGNVAEEYALPLAFLVWVWLADLIECRPAFWRGLGIGGALAAAALLSPPLAGLGLTVVFILILQAFVQRRARGLLAFVWMALGAALVWGCAAGVFARAGILHAVWSDAFLYPFVYTTAATLDKINALWAELGSLAQLSGMILFGLAGWLAAIPFLLFYHPAARRVVFSRLVAILSLAVALYLLYSGLIDNTGRLYALKALSLYRVTLITLGVLAVGVAGLIFSGWVKRQFLPRLDALTGTGPGSSAGVPWGFPLLVAFVDLPVQLVLAAFFWRGSTQYFVFLLPGLTILLAFILDGPLHFGAFGTTKYARFFWLFPLGLGLFVSGVWGSVYTNLNPLIDRLVLNQAVSKTLEYLAAQKPGQTFLQWGDENRLYFLTGQTAPVRDSSLSLLFSRAPQAQPAQKEFLSQLQSARPALILDTRGENYPLIVPIDGQCATLDNPATITAWLQKDQKTRYRYTEKSLPYVPNGMIAIYRWVCDNYIYSGTTGQGQWPIYLLKAH